MNIAQIRAKYPQYNDLSDKQLADALHGKFYSDLPIQDYYKRIGFAPETTVLGQVKEFGKGLIPGAVGLVEQAAIGASALLPEETEKAAREKIASIAGAAKAPFAAAPGYEESVGRKSGQAVGSTVPFLAAGPLGLAGRLGAVGLGVGAGAGEARTRAEESGATAEQRATATALGIAPGALEVFAPFRILSRIPDAATAQGVQLVKRAALAGGEEAAQEAASNFAQNLIAKGVYKPEQELIEGLGEAAAYGGATGAIVQGLLDLALGRRARAAQTAPTEAPIVRAERLAAEKAAAEAPPPAPAAEIPPVPESYVDLVLYTERLKLLPKSKERDAALKEAYEKRKALVIADVEAQRGAAEKAKGFMTAEEAAAAQITPREEVTPPETPPAPPAAETPTPPVEEPKVRKVGEPAPLPDVLDAPTIAKIGFTRGSIHNMLVGKSVTDPEVREVLQTYLDAKREEGTLNPKTEAKINAFLARLPEAAAPTTAPAVPVTETPSADATQPEAGGAGAPVAGEPGAGTAPGGAGVVEPTGVVPPVADAQQPAGGEGQQPAPVTPPALAPAPAPAPAAPKEKGSLETRIKALNINAAVGGVPDLKVVRGALESRDPKMYQAVAYYLGLDPEGNLLVGANNMPQTPSAQEAAQMAGLGTNSGDRVIKVAKALGITAPIIRKFQASQNETFAAGRSKTTSEAGTGARLESPETALITDQEWYKPVAAKGLKGANHTEIARAVLLGQRFLQNKENEPVFMEVAKEAQARAKRPEFAAAFKSQQSLLAPDQTGFTRGKADEDALTAEPEYEDDVAPGREEAVEEGKDRGEEIESETRARETIYPDITPEAAQYIQEQIQGKSLIEAAQFTADLFKEGDQKLIAEKTVERLRRMEAAGVKFGFVVVENGTRAPTSVASGTARGVSVLKFTNGKPDITVYLRAHDLGSSGINPRIMLHEFLHAATQAGIELGVRNAAVGSDISRMTISLIEAQRAFAKHFNARIAEFKAGKTELSEIEEAMYNRNVNAGVDAHEFLAWGLTSPKFQQYLETIPYKGRSLWTKFVDSIRSFLGMSPQADTLLSELLHVSEEILNADPNEEIAVGKRILGTQQAPAVQSAAITPQTEEAVKGLDVIGEQKEARPMSGNPAIKARIRVANNMAGLFDKFNEWYGGAIRTSGNRLIPSIFLSRALDADRISNEAQLVGGLQKVNELIVAGEIRDANGNQVLGVDGKPLSYANVLKRIADAAKKEGKSYEQYKSVIDKVLYGHREFNIRENNRIIEQQAAALEAIGKKDEAKKLREDIAVLAIKDNAKLDQIEAEFQNSEFIKGVSSDFDAIRFNFIDMLVETGRISKEVAQEWKDNNGYIPFNRTQDYEEAFDAEGSRVRGVGVTRNIKKFKGSTRQSTSVIDNFSKLLDWATGEAMRNEAKNRALKDMVLMGAAKPRNGKTLASDEPGGVVKTFEDGVAQEYIVPDPMLFVGFTMHTPEMNKVIQAFNRYGTRVLRAGVTMMPPFAIKQVFDDITRAYTFAGVKDNVTLTKNILTNFPKNWLNEILNKEVWKTAAGQTSVKELRRLGIVASFDLSREGNLKNIEVEAGAKGETLWNKVLRIMEAGAKASDVSVRQAIYDQVLKETKDQVQAESAAREIINFSYQGAESTVRNIASVVPFFNAYAQGTDKLAVAAAGKVVGMTPGAARSMFYTRMTVLTALGFAYALMMQDDEEYNKLPDHVRDTNWIIPGAKIAGMPVGIPVPQDLAFFFKAIPERVVRYYKYQGTEEERAAVEVLSQLAARGYDVFSPPNVTPQLIRPLFENLVNYSFFLGRPLESQAQIQQLRPFERYGVGTSDSMKIVARWLENLANATGIDAFAVSPIKLENAMRGLLGTTGGTALAVVDMMVNPSRTDRPLHQQLSTQLTGASAVLKNSVGTAFMDEIYNLEKRVEQVNGTYNRLLKTQPEKAEGYLNDNIGIYSIRGPVQGIMDAIRTLNEAAMTIDRDTSLSPEERRKLIDELRVEQNEIARVVFSLRKQARDIQAGL
jgi:hypothetical protein